MENYAFIDSQNLNRRFSGLLKFKNMRLFLRYMNDLRDRLAVKERAP